MADQGNALIKTPRQLITVLVLALGVPVVVIILLATYVVSSSSGGAGSDAMSVKAIAARMEPVGVVVLATAGAVKEFQSGEAVYKGSCSACHATGVAGAPRTGDLAVWAPRIRQRFDLLVKHAVDGFKTMPPEGGNPSLDAIEVARAVAFMANQSGAKFKEPAAPPAGAPTAAGAVPAGAPTSPATLATVPAAAAAVGAKAAITSAKPDGAKVFASGCNVCHATGVAGAPKLADKAGWAPRIGLGIDALTAAVIKGKGAMPPRGAHATASDAELRAAVEYMVASIK